MSRQWVSRQMRVAPPLDESLRPGPPVARTALLLNPYYPKDPHASFGKHVLTPTWALSHWDENLLHGPPPVDPMPQVVGITVHLTFARRAFALADWYLARGATVILGGLHVLSCPDECAPHADGLAIGEGVQLWPRILADARKRSPRPADYARRVGILHDLGIQVNGSFVLGFDHDVPNVFAHTVDWIERARLECATFHILTPYPGTSLFRQMEAQGRLLHRDWERYDTGHVVFRPAKMTEQELADGYAWCYRRLFGHASIWRRRPTDVRAAPAYLAMSYLYKRSNRLWHHLIRHDSTAIAWRPLVEWTRRRHVRFRRRLAADGTAARPAAVVAAGM